MRNLLNYLGVVIGVQSEPVVDSGWQNDKIAGLDPDANPIVFLVSNIKVAASFQTVTYLLVGMYVLRVEVLQLLFVVLHFLRA